jgi:cyclopropane fatty-acyl-phospholipid synthase-like methyltransferase
VTDPRTQLVAQTYDAIADRFAAWRDRIQGDPRDWWLEQLHERLPDGARVLELGCGSGLPDTKALTERYSVTAVDISSEQIARARRNAPAATLVHADLTTLDLPSASFEAVVAVYVLNQVPRERLGALFSLVHAWLVPGGLLLCSLGASDVPGWTGEWLGATTFFAGFPPEVNRRLLADAGFTLLLDDVVCFREPEGDVRFHWVLGRAEARRYEARR